MSEENKRIELLKNIEICSTDAKTEFIALKMTEMIIAINKLILAHNKTVERMSRLAMNRKTGEKD